MLNGALRCAGRALSFKGTKYMHTWEGLLEALAARVRSVPSPRPPRSEFCHSRAQVCGPKPAAHFSAVLVVNAERQVRYMGPEVESVDGKPTKGLFPWTALFVGIVYGPVFGEGGRWR